MAEGQKRILVFYRKFYYSIYFILVFGIIFAFYPKQGKFKYEFQQGKPWLHETLIAPFDFAILKDKNELGAERDSLLHNFIPYFTYDPKVEVRELTLLESALDSFYQKIKGITPDEVTNAKAILLDMYSGYYRKGILLNSSTSYSILEGKKNLNMIENNMATMVDIESVLSLKSAYILANEQLNEISLTNNVLLKAYLDFDLNQYLEPNLEYDQSLSESRMNEILSSIAVTRGAVQAGVRIISQGEMVNEVNFNVLESFKEAYQQKQAYGGWLAPTMIGNMILVLILMFLLVYYLKNFNNKIFLQKRNYSLILTLIAIFFIATKLIYSNPSTSIYIIPFCILPIVIRTFLGARMAIFIHLITLLMVCDMAGNSLEFVFTQIVAGTIAVMSLNKLHKRGNLIITALLVVLSYALVSFGFLLAKNGSIALEQIYDYSWILISGLLVMLAYLIIYVFERIFGFVSDVTLMELSDANHPLLRKLAEEAPGTFQHSMQVANLAEEVVVRTSGNPLLVRAGALYHDVGKIASSQYFIENQVIGQNPHETLNHMDSAKKIISHVFDGVTLARKYKIPEPIIDFIKMHHGKSMARYFYLKYKEENPGKEISEADFMYPGPNPTTRETAILMLADGVEAAARSLPEKNEVSLKKIIDQIIDAKVQNNELDDAPITFKDIKTIKLIFLNKLKNIYHVRIEYPKEK